MVSEHVFLDNYILYQHLPPRYLCAWPENSLLFLGMIKLARQRGISGYERNAADLPGHLGRSSLHLSRYSNKTSTRIPLWD